MLVTYCRKSRTATCPSIIIIIRFIIAMKKQVYTYEKEITIPDTKFGSIVFSLSKYSDCLVIFMNQTGAIGSIIEGVAAESTAELAEEGEFDAQSASKPNFIYDIRVLFGSTEIQFYELLLRRIMGVIWEELKVPCLPRVLLNISLPVLHGSFKEEEYYSILVEECRLGLKNVI